MHPAPSSDSSLTIHHFMKRQRRAQVDADNDSEGVDPGAPRTRVRFSATHEIRQLRAQVAAMEEKLQTLQRKWTQELPCPHTRKAAHHSAREKYEVTQIENVHLKLENVHIQEQIKFASLQTSILHAPLYSNWEKMLQALHFKTKLGRDPKEREKALVAHHKRSLATIPSNVDTIAQAAIDKVLARRSKTDKIKPVTPLSHVDITGLKDSSLVSSVFISEFPNATLEQVYKAILVSFFQAIPALMKRHFGINVTRKMLNSANAPVKYWRLNLDGNAIPLTVNHVMCSELTSSYGMFHVDAITDDVCNPIPSTRLVQYGVCGITLTPQKEPGTGRTLSVKLQWLGLYHYNMLPDDLAFVKDLKTIRPFLNGDLITSSVCEYLAMFKSPK